MSTYNSDVEYIYSDYLPGQEYTIDVLCDMNKPLTSVIRKRLQTKAGISTKGKIIRDKYIEQECMRICKFLNLKGAICIQMKEDDTGTPKFIEINPRFGGGTYFTTLAGVNFVQIILDIINNKDLKRVSSGYGTRIDPFLKVKRMHYGQDFSLPKGSPVYATADGRISILKSSFGGFGKYIYIDHGNGYKTVYAHLDKFNVRRGQKVKRGELIAYSGNSGRSTAPHLHYEVHKNGNKRSKIYL